MLEKKEIIQRVDLYETGQIRVTKEIVILEDGKEIVRLPSVRETLKASSTEEQRDKVKELTGVMWPLKYSVDEIKVI